MAATFRTTPLAKIASGGTATVFVGVSRTRHELVALKRPHPHVLEDERQRAEVLREAAVAAAIHHENVVRVHAVETSGDEVQLVMEYVEGAALGGLIAVAVRKDMRLPAGIAVRIVLDAGLGLAAVHRQTDPSGRLLGLVHRDVSPQNILVGRDGRARLTDFGLAKAMYTAAPSTTQGTLKGKLGYMAPEYVHRGQVDCGVDVFAMGVVLWEAVAGKRLFRGDNEAQTLDRILRDNAPLLSDISAELAPLDEVVARATAKEPRARFASADELAAALGAAGHEMQCVASAEDVAAYVESAVREELVERRARINAALRARRRPLWIALGSLAAASSAGGFALVMHARQPAVPRPEATAPPSSITRVQEDAGTQPPIEFGLPDARPAPSSRAPTRSAPPPARTLPPNPYDRHSH